MIETYESIPSKVKALQLFNDLRCIEELKELMGEFYTGLSIFDAQLTINISTLNGVVSASEGDWIVKDSDGKFYKRTDEAFKNNYKKVI